MASGRTNQQPWRAHHRRSGRDRRRPDASVSRGVSFDVFATSAGMPQSKDLYMSDIEVPEASSPELETSDSIPAESTESFSDILSQFEKGHSRQTEDGNR